MNIKIFCCCSLFPSWSGYGLISTPVQGHKVIKHFSIHWPQNPTVTCENSEWWSNTRQSSSGCIHTARDLSLPHWRKSNTEWTETPTQISTYWGAKTAAAVLKCGDQEQKCLLWDTRLSQWSHWTAKFPGTSHCHWADSSGLSEGIVDLSSRTTHPLMQSYQHRRPKDSRRFKLHIFSIPMTNYLCIFYTLTG
jgi:hypothetical protein